MSPHALKPNKAYPIWNRWNLRCQDRIFAIASRNRAFNSSRKATYAESFPHNLRVVSNRHTRCGTRPYRHNPGLFFRLCHAAPGHGVDTGRLWSERPATAGALYAWRWKPLWTQPFAKPCRLGSRRHSIATYEGRSHTTGDYCGNEQHAFTRSGISPRRNCRQITRDTTS